MPEVSVIVPARDAAATIGATLRGLAVQEDAPAFEVILVDDGSRDTTRAIAEAAPVAVRVVAGAGEGPARARNRGAAAATAPLLAFLDADCEPAPAWLAAGTRALAEADLVQGMTRPRPEDAPGPFDKTLWVMGPHGLFESANLFVRRELFERLGGFESWLRPRSGIELGEDVWFGWSAVRAGARTAFCAEAIVWHAVFPRRPREYVAERARLRFFPAMARRVPELREHFFFRRVFLSSRTAAFDLALAGAVLAATRRSPLPLLAAVPYARLAGGRPLRLAGIDAVADAAGLAALAAGSAQYRSLVL